MAGQLGFSLVGEKYTNLHIGFNNEMCKAINN